MPLPQLRGVDAGQSLRLLEDIRSGKRRERLEDIAVKRGEAADKRAEAAELRSGAAENRAAETHKYDIRHKKIKSADDLLDYGVKSLGMTTLETYTPWRNEMIGLGFPADEIPPVASFKSPADLDAFKEQVRGSVLEYQQDKGKPSWEQKTVYLPDGGTVSHPVKKGEVFDPAKVYGQGATLERKKESKEPAERVPPQVKQAQSMVLKFAKTVDPTVAALISTNPKMANSPLVKQAMQAGIPENLKPAYDEAVKILNSYYGVEAKQPGAGAGSGGGDITHEFVPGKGLVEAAR